MDVIDFRGTRQITHDGDTIVKVYSDNELMWKMATKLPGVYSRDEVDLEGLSRISGVMGFAYQTGRIGFQVKTSSPVKYIEVNNTFIEMLDEDLELDFGDTKLFSVDRFNKSQAENILGVPIGQETVMLFDVNAWH